MKLLKKILSVLLSFSLVSLHARQMGGKATPQPMAQQKIPAQAQPVNRPAIVPQQKPAAQQTSYAQALNSIRMGMPSNQVILNNKFAPPFITFVTSLNLSNIQTQALLEAGINLHATLTDSDQIDKQVLLSLHNSMQAIIQNKPQPIVQPMAPRKPAPPAAPKQPATAPKQAAPAQPAIPVQPIPVKSPAAKQQKRPARAAQQPTPQKQQPVQVKPAPPGNPVVRQPQVKKPEPLQPSPTQNYSITNSVVMALDPRKKETVNTAAESLVQQTLLALYQKAAPVIMTNNILEIILTVRKRIGDQNFQKLRTAGFQQLFAYAKQLAPAIGIPGIRDSSVILLSGIDFNTINIYFHKTENLALLIPKEYIRANIPQAINANVNDQAQACGFNPQVLRALSDTTIDNLLKQLQVENTRLPQENKFIDHLTSMFTLQKRNGELIHPERDSKWLIYIVGHGSPSFLTIGTVRQQYNMIKQSVENARQALSWGARLPADQRNKAQQYLQQYEPKAQEYERMLEGRSQWANTQIVPGSAQIAGIAGSDFAQLMTFFDESLDTAYVHYITCFSGGSNQTFVNETLSSLNVHFIVSTQGVQESYTSTWVGIRPGGKTGIEITKQNLSEFFRLLKMFFTQQEQFVKLKQKEGKGTDPILLILKTIIPPDDALQNEPFVRFPGAGAFTAAPQTANTQTITTVMARAHEIEKKPFDFSDPNINAIIINTPRINVPIDFGKKGAQGHTALVTPSPSSFVASYESIHMFKEIKWQDTLQSLLFNCCYLNNRLYPQTFIINKLSDVLLQQSGLQGKPGSSINNLIIHTTSVSGVNRNTSRPPLQLTPLTGQALVGSDVGLNINVAFELDNTIYQTFFAINDFERPDELYQNMQSLKFTATPKQSTKMDALASNFLTPQEITQVRKPITLESIADFIDDKIDKQDPSMAIWAEADEDALLKMVQDKTRQQKQNRRKK